MGFFSNAGDFTKRVTKGTAKGSAKFIWWGTKKAAKGSVWIVKKAAVNVSKKQISDWSLVSNTAEVRARLTRGECAGCGKKFNSKAGKFQFCSDKCSLEAFESWSRVEQKKVNVHAKPKSNENDLYYPCGVHNKNGWHEWQHDQICGG